MNVDPAEIQKFESLAQRWWDKNGEFRPLHDINDIRVRFIADRTTIRGAEVLDVGCGGGILTESLTSHGAIPTGIDPAPGPLTVAKLHAVEMGLQDQLNYFQSTAEEYSQEQKEFDIVTAMEILEHVPDFSETMQALASLTKSGGDIFLSTINRKPIAYLVAILGAEYVLNVLPRGTHEYRKFIKPSELSQAARDAGLIVRQVKGYSYNPFSRSASLASDPNVNYLFHAQKP